MQPPSQRTSLLPFTPSPAQPGDVRDHPPPARDPAGRCAGAVAELQSAWERGQRLTAADLFARYPELAADEEAAFWLVYHELGLLERFVPTFDRAAFLNRYDRWRDELGLLLQNRLPPPDAEPEDPKPGDRLGEFELLAELGRGGQGSVFLARQPGLANRAVVLKCSANETREHLNLARLQHTHIVPLFQAFDDPARKMRVICLPWLGGTTVDRVLWELRDVALSHRNGASVLAVLETLTLGLPDRPPQAGPIADALANESWERVICWIGACLADALQDAHARGLMHFDIKPGNVLLAADGTPMLLDFHLSRGPVLAGDPLPDWFGGTRAYASPEQIAAMSAIRGNRAIPLNVDGRSDVYSLGVLLDEALGGKTEPEDPAPLRERNPAVTVGLADIIAKTKQPDAARRYQTAGELAEDLRRFLAGQPLVGVPNRDARERLARWHRRHPRLPVAIGVGLTVLTLAVAAITPWVRNAWDRGQRAEASLVEGDDALRAGDLDQAEQSFRVGAELAADVPFSTALHERLAERRAKVADAMSRQELRRAVDGLRFLYGLRPPADRASRMAERCRELWQQRERFADADEDLIDLAILVADLSAQSSPADRKMEAAEAALRTLDEAAELVGDSLVLQHERAYWRGVLGKPDSGPLAEPTTAWEWYAVGRRTLQIGRVIEAASLLERATDDRPGAFWPHYLLAVCRHRQGRLNDAERELGVCIALAPDRPECHFDRGMVRMDLGQPGAERDFERALKLDPTLWSASVNLGVLATRRSDWSAARQAFERARSGGGSGPDLFYNLALTAFHLNDWSAARGDARRALTLVPGHAEALDLLKRMGER